MVVPTGGLKNELNTYFGFVIELLSIVKIGGDLGNATVVKPYLKVK